MHHFAGVVDEFFIFMYVHGMEGRENDTVLHYMYMEYAEKPIYKDV